MLKYIVGIVVSCWVVQLSAQKEMKKTELSSDFFLADVNSNGNKMFVVKYKSACIAYNKKNKEFLLYGDADGTNIIFLEKIPNVPLRFYPDKFTSCYFKEGKVYLSSQITGKATVVTGIFNWKDEHLIWEKEETFDLSELQVARAKGLLKNGNVLPALATYDSVQFSDAYYDAQTVGIELLISSNTSVEELMAKKKYKEAVEMMDRILAFKGMKWLPDTKTEADLKTLMGKNLHGLTYAALQGYMELYTKSLLEAKQFDKAIEKTNAYWKYFTGSAGLMLNYADAWYAKKDKVKASEFYVKYTALMKQTKKEKDIPYYVPQRIETE
jgi:hypothetical protein